MILGLRPNKDCRICAGSGILLDNSYCTCITQQPEYASRAVHRSVRSVTRSVYIPRSWAMHDPERAGEAFLNFFKNYPEGRGWRVTMNVEEDGIYQLVLTARKP